MRPSGVGPWPYPIAYILFTVDLPSVLAKRQIKGHSYADDIQSLSHLFIYLFNRIFTKRPFKVHIVYSEALSALAYMMLNVVMSEYFQSVQKLNIVS